MTVPAQNNYFAVIKVVGVGGGGVTAVNRMIVDRDYKYAAAEAPQPHAA